jgi:hypothetical protein
MVLGATFELSKCCFSEAMGTDYSIAFIKAAELVRLRGSMSYSSVVEIDLKVRYLTTLSHVCLVG